MEVTVKDKFLNVRVGEPSVNAPTYQYLAPGSKITVEERLYDGDYFNDSNKWLRDLAGNYYWAGGVENLPSITDLRKSMDIVGGLPFGLGDGVTIAILDTGIDIGHIYLAKRIIDRRDFLTNKETLSNSHATKVAGIICNNDSQQKGISPMVNIIDYRVIGNNQYVDINALVSALKYLVENQIDVDVINMSFSINFIDVNKVQPYIDLLHQKGCVFIVAGGDAIVKNQITSLNSPFFVGTFDLDDDPKIQNKYSVSFCDKPIRSTALIEKIYEDISGDSAYTAIMSGLVAAYLSTHPTKASLRHGVVSNFISSTAVSLNNQSNILNFKPYKS